MAQPIAAEIWQNGISDSRFLPGRHSLNIFTGNGVPIANNIGADGVNNACRVWDIQISDYITDYDDRRLNGLSGTNADGRDGWGASAFGVFQDVRFTSRVYTMGRHRSIAWRIFDEMQYSGGIGNWGTDTQSHEYTNGQGLLKTAQIISQTKDLWDKEVLGPDIDKYNLFAIFNGHISGRFVQDNPDQIFNGEGTWVAQPGMVQGESIPPRFAPIMTVEWDKYAVGQLLENISVTWDNLNIPSDNRVILMDKRYRYSLMQSLFGEGIPVTEAGYADMKEGQFTRLLGWDFDFEIPAMYWPQLYVDANGNVVHSPTGTAAYDLVLNSINGGADPTLELQNKLVASNRMQQTNYIRTVWNNTTKTFDNVITNYPLGAPVAEPYFGLSESETYASRTLPDPFGEPSDYPYSGYPGHGIKDPTGPEAPIVRKQVIGCAVYRPSGQLSQEWSEMRTDEGNTRGKFTEVVMDFKHDAWVIENLSAGILPIVDTIPDEGAFGMPVKQVGKPAEDISEIAEQSGSMAESQQGIQQATASTASQAQAMATNTGAISTKTSEIADNTKKIADNTEA